MFVTKKQCEIFISKELKNKNYLNFQCNNIKSMNEKSIEIKTGKKRKINIIELE